MVQNRERQREESQAAQREYELEGWAEIYSVLDNMKLTPIMDEYFRQPGKFAELRRMWETQGAGVSWEQWLRNYDFKGEWFKKSPYERGERPAAFAPRMTTRSY